MRKKELLKEISSTLKEGKEQTPSMIDSLGEELFVKIFKLNFIHVIIYTLFLISSVLLFHKIDHLSFISEDFYINLVAIFTVISTLIAIIFFTLYIYNRKKNELINRNQLTKSFKFYQMYDLFSFISLFITIFLWIVIFVVTPVEVSGESMEETFYDGDKILVWHIGYSPEIDDVVIIDSVDYLNTEFIIKRIVATSGDVVKYNETDKTISVNGLVVADNIEKNEYQTMLTDKLNNKTYYSDGIVPEGYSIVLGDNQGNSTDSRVIGLISADDILGKCIFRIYPLTKFGVPTKK